DSRIGVHADRSVFPRARGHQGQAAPTLFTIKVLLFVAGFNTLEFRQNPDLQEVRTAILQVVEFAVRDARTCAHALYVARSDDAAVGRTRLAVAHAVFVGQFAVKHIADDFHVPMAMGTEALSGGNRVVIDDAQVAVVLVLDIEVIPEREAVGALEPAAMGGPATFL